MTPAAGAPVSHVRSTGLARAFYIVGLAVLFMFIVQVGSAVLIPLVIAVFLAFLIVTLKNIVERIPVIGARLPAWVGFLIAFAAIGAGFVIFAEIVTANIEAVIAKAPEYQKRLTALSGQIIARLQEWGAPIPEEYAPGLIVSDAVLPLLRELAAPARAIAANTVTIFLYTGFLLVERGAFTKKIALMSGNAADRAHVDKLLTDIAGLMRQYISVKTFTSVLTGLLSYPVMLAIGIDFAGFWTILIIVLNFIPIIGSIVGVLFPVMLTALQFGDITKFLIAAVALTSVQQLVGSIIEPRIMGKSMNLSPLVILLSLSVWGSIWGVAGMLLSVPIMAIVTIALSQFQTTRPFAILLSQDGNIAELRRGSPPSDKKDKDGGETQQ